MPSSRRSRPRARSQPRFGPPPLDHSPPRRSPSTIPDGTRSRAFKFLKVILQYYYPNSFGGKDEVSSGSTRLSPEGWEFLQKILSMLREEDFQGFYKPERNWKLTYSAKRRRLYYTMPNDITQSLFGCFDMFLFRQRYAISQDHLKNDIDSNGFELDKCFSMLTGPWPIRIGEAWDEVRLDRVAWFRGPELFHHGPCFGIEASFADDYRLLKRKVMDAMRKRRGPSMMILFRIGYGSADAYENAALDPEMVAALDKTADFSIFQVYSQVDENGQRCEVFRRTISHQVFRKSDGSAAKGNLEFTVRDLIGWESKRRIPPVTPSESLLERKITIPFSSLAEWINEGEETVMGNLIREHQFGPFLPEPVYNKFIDWTDSDDSGG